MNTMGTAVLVACTLGMREGRPEDMLAVQWLMSTVPGAPMWLEALWQRLLPEPVPSGVPRHLHVPACEIIAKNALIICTFISLSETEH